jgi:ribose transport system permease protein
MKGQADCSVLRRLDAARRSVTGTREALTIMTSAVAPFQTARRSAALIAFGVMTGLFWLLLPGTFMTMQNWLTISQQMSMLAVVACTMTIVMTMGDFDLSVGSMASLAAIIAARVFETTGLTLPGIAAGLLAGLAGGLVNGLLVSRLRMLPFVATLGTLTIFAGLAFIASGGKTIFGAAIPAAFSNIARGGIPLWMSGESRLILPNLTILALLVFAATAFALERMVFGRHLRAIGGGGEAARLAGVPVERLRIAAYALSGLGAAMAGLMVASRVASANPVQGAGLMLDAIAAVFIGMAMNPNGEPRVLYTLLGVLLLGILGNGLTQLSIDSYVRQVAIGIIVLLAVAMAGIGRKPQ